MVDLQRLIFRYVNILHSRVSVAVSGDFCLETSRKCSKF